MLPTRRSMSLLALNRSPRDLRNTLSPKIKSLTQNYTSLLSIYVQWGDQDAYGHLNNVSYARYAESSRIAFFDQIIRPAISPEIYDTFINGTKVASILKSITIRYQAPVLHPDVIIMASRVPAESLLNDRFTHQFIAVSVAQEKIVASGEAVVVTFDYEKQRKAPIPENIREAMIKAEQSNNKESKL